MAGRREIVGAVDVVRDDGRGTQMVWVVGRDCASVGLEGLKLPLHLFEYFVGDGVASQPAGEAD